MCKLYQLPIIGDTVQQLEEFHIETAMALNMGYYTIELSTHSRDMIIIVVKFGKIKYDSMKMVMCTSGDIFQAEVDELLGITNVVIIYIGDF